MSKLLAFCFLPVLFYAQKTTQEEIKLYDDGEAYNVYSAVLTLEKTKGTVLIADETVGFNHCTEPRSDKPVDAAIKNYKKANQSRWRLGYHFGSNQPYRLLSEQEADALLEPDKRTGDWPLSPETGIHRFSAVGFNSEKTMAFLEMDVICGGLCGHGQPYILEKREGRWKEYSGPEPKIIKGKKLKDGSYVATMKWSGPTSCGWFY